MAGSRAARLGIALLCALGLGVTAAATPAMAIHDGYTYLRQWGEGGTGPSQFNAYMYAVAVDESSGDVYVTDDGNARVQKFDEEGHFLQMWGFGVKDGSNEYQVCVASEPCQAGLAGYAPGQFENPQLIAVDNSNGPNQGRVYVGDTPGFGNGRNLIFKFSPNGAYEGIINGEATPDGVFSGLCCDNLDVDSTGVVWVGDGDRVMRFSNQPSNAYIGGSQFTFQVPIYYEGGLPGPAPVGALHVVPDASEALIESYYEGECCGFYRAPANGSNTRLVAYTTRAHPFPTGPSEIDPSNGHVLIGTSENYETIHEYDGDPNELHQLGTPFSGWEYNGERVCCGTSDMAVNANTSIMYMTVLFGGRVVAFRPRLVPETITEPATEVRHTTATLHGHTAPDPTAGGDVSECFFQWGTTKNYEHKDPCQPAAPISKPTDVELDLTNLLQEGTYHYRLGAKNSIDTEYGADRTFTTHAVLGMETGKADEITPVSANLHGSFDPDGLQTSYYFEWGRNEKLGETGQVTPVKDASGTGTTPVSQRLEGLEDYTHYYYRLAATNNLGTSYGAKYSFRTIPPGPPTVSQNAASAVTDVGAHLSAMVNPNFAETIYGFEYGETFAYGDQVLGGGLLEADSENHPVSVNIEALKPGQTYHFRALGTNFGGISYSPDQTFTTLDTPKVISESATGTTSSGARLNALVHPSLSPTSVHFEYGPTGAYGTSTPANPIGGGASPVSTGIDVGGLAASTTYHFRAVATNAIGTEVGFDQTFYTPAGSTPPPEEKPKPCKRGFLRRHGRCVRRRRHKHHKAARRDYRTRPAAIAAAPDRR